MCARSHPYGLRGLRGQYAVSYTHLDVYKRQAFNLTKRQLVCFGSAGAVGIPAYLLTRGTLGNTGAMFLMLGIMLPAFLLAMYEKDGLPFEKVVRNIIRAKFLRPGTVSYTHLQPPPTRPAKAVSLEKDLLLFLLSGSAPGHFAPCRL